MNVVVKSKGKVLEFFEDADLEEIKERFQGFEVEETEERYSKKWGKWWCTYSPEDDF